MTERLHRPPARVAKCDDDTPLTADEVKAKVLDLGGTNAGTAQVVEVDRAGLTDGELSTMKFFFAHRASDSVPFRIRTKIPLKTKGKVTTATGGLYD